MDFSEKVFDTKPSYISNRVKDLTGFTPEEFYSGEVQFYEQVNPNEAEDVLRLTKKLISEKCPVTRVYRFLCKDGKYKWFEDSLVPKFNDKGNIIGCFGVATEITKRKNAEEAIRDFEKFFALAQDMLCIAGTDGYFKKINKSFSRILGYSNKELLSKPFLEFVHPDDLKKTEKELVKLSKGFPTIRFENRYICKNGKYKWLSWTSTKANREGIVYAAARDITAKKEAEEKLRQNQAFLDSIVENIPNMIFVKDARELKFVKFNKAGEELLGFSRKEMIGKNDYDFFPKKEADFFTKKDQQVLNNKEMKDIAEEEIKTKNKGKRYLHTRKIPLYDKNGKPEYLLGISEDITEAKQAREALRRSEEKYRDIVHLIQEGIWMIDAESKTSFVNEEMAKMLGYTVEEMIGKSMFDFMDEEGKDIAKKNIAKRKKGIAEVHDFKLKTKDGTDRWTIMNTRPILDAKEKYLGAIAAVVDVTERRRAEDIIKENEQRLREAQKIANVGSWEYEVASNTITWSEETFRLFGLKPGKEAPSLDKFRKLIHPDDRELLAEKVEQAITKGIPYDIEMRAVLRSGEIRYLQGRGMPVEKDGRIVKLIGTGVDITERKLYETRIMKALVDGQDIERKRIAEDLHDSLGQKLSAIRINWATLERDTDMLSAKSVEAYNNMKGLLNEAVEEVRNISHNLMPGTLEDFGIEIALNDLCNKIHKSDGINVNFQVHGKTEKLGKSVQMGVYRISQELINNAIKHSKAQELNVQLFKRDKKLILSVEDDGVGFDLKKEKVDQTFGFNSITSRVKALNGTFTLESKPGKGTLASIEIPLEL